MYELRGRLGLREDPRRAELQAMTPFRRRLTWILENYPPRVVHMLRRAYHHPLEKQDGADHEAQVLDWLARALNRDGWPSSWDEIDVTTLAMSSFDDYLANREENADQDDDPGDLVTAAWDDARDAAREDTEDRERRYQEAEDEWYKRPPVDETWIEWDDDGPIFRANVPNSSAVLTARVKLPDKSWMLTKHGSLYVSGIEDPNDELPSTIAYDILDYSCDQTWTKLGVDVFIEDWTDDIAEAVRSLLCCWRETYENVPFFFLRSRLDDDRRAHPQISWEGIGIEEALDNAAERLIRDLVEERKRTEIDDDIADSQEHVIVRWHDGESVVEITGGHALRREGQRMHHCVGLEQHGHPKELREGKVRILSYRRADGTPTATLELDAVSGYAKDIEGPYNGPVAERGRRVRLAATLDRLRRSALVTHNPYGEYHLKGEACTPQEVLLFGAGGGGDGKILHGLPSAPEPLISLLAGVWTEVAGLDEEAFSLVGWAKPYARRMAVTHLQDYWVRESMRKKPDATPEQILGSSEEWNLGDYPPELHDTIYEAMVEAVIDLTETE
jgi:hypothetical protein